MEKDKKRSDSATRRHGESLVGEMEDRLIHELRKRGGVMDDAIPGIVRGVMSGVVKNFGGIPLYIPKDVYKNMEIAERNRAICDAFSGKNISELAQRFSLTSQSIRDILKAEGAQRKAQRAALEAAR